MNSPIRQGALHIVLFVISPMFPFLCATPLNASPRLIDDYNKVYDTRRTSVAECIDLTKTFNTYDLFRVANSNRLLGLDLHGRIWSLQKTTNDGCVLTASFRLDKADYENDYLGRRIWLLYTYEDSKLCRYRKHPDRANVSRDCYNGVGVVNKYAPYWSSSK